MTSGLHKCLHAHTNCPPHTTLLHEEEHLCIILFFFSVSNLIYYFLSGYLNDFYIFPPNFGFMENTAQR